MLIMDKDRVVFQIETPNQGGRFFLMNVNQKVMREITPFYRYAFQKISWDGKAIQGVFTAPDSSATKPGKRQFDIISVDPETLEVVSTRQVPAYEVNWYGEPRMHERQSIDKKYHYSHYDSSMENAKDETVDVIRARSLFFWWALDRDRFYFIEDVRFLFINLRWLCYRDYQ